MADRYVPLTEALARVVADAFLLYERSSEAELDPDTAVKHLEVLAYELRRVSPADRQRLVALLRGIETEVGPRGWVDELVEGTLSP